MNAKIEVEVNLEFSLPNNKDFSKNVHKFIEVEINPVNPIKNMTDFFHELWALVSFLEDEARILTC